MNKIFLLTGGNIGDRKKNVEIAAAFIQKEIGSIVQSSKIYETEAWGIKDQASFYNQVLLIESKFSAKEILQKILKIEEGMGRVRTIKNAARIIDIDILFFNHEVINEPNLNVPHPEIVNRRFVLTPLNELAPNLVHPVLNKSIHYLLANCKDELKVTATS
jgi:2-amino-4-hydroxy-6-hydroxymethyldihydropteridine diphosphokinase